MPAEWRGGKVLSSGVAKVGSKNKSAPQKIESKLAFEDVLAVRQ